jgi:hypothetical protein
VPDPALLWPLLSSDRRGFSPNLPRRRPEKLSIREGRMVKPAPTRPGGREESTTSTRLIGLDSATRYTGCTRSVTGRPWRVGKPPLTTHFDVVNAIDQGGWPG